MPSDNAIEAHVKFAMARGMTTMQRDPWSFVRDAPVLSTSNVLGLEQLASTLLPRLLTTCFSYNAVAVSVLVIKKTLLRLIRASVPSAMSKGTCLSPFESV
jgi:hypothetical protein